MERTTTRVIGPADGKSGSLGAIGVRFMVNGAAGGFSLVEHPMPARALAAPMHRHSREDEYSYVLKGRVGANLGGEIVYGGPGDLIFKPRDQWHTFWNAGDEPASILEIISPSGFEACFEEMAAAVAAGRVDPAQMVELAARFGVELQLDSVPQLVADHGLVFLAPPAHERV